MTVRGAIVKQQWIVWWLFHRCRVYRHGSIQWNTCARKKWQEHQGMESNGCRLLFLDVQVQMMLKETRKIFTLFAKQLKGWWNCILDSLAESAFVLGSHDVRKILTQFQQHQWWPSGLCGRWAPNNSSPQASMQKTEIWFLRTAFTFALHSGFQYRNLWVKYRNSCSAHK